MPAVVSYDWNYNTFVGPVPVTGQFTCRATAEVIFKAAVLGGEQIKLQYNENTVNNYLTTLRIYAYIRAFAGFGFDYSVAALKIGLFGQISGDLQFAFLNQPHISSTLSREEDLMYGEGRNRVCGKNPLYIL